MKYLQKSAFSILEMILSLILLSIVSTFVFRYIHIFYTNYNQTKSLYYQNIDLDKSLVLLHSILTKRVAGSEIVSKKSNSYKLESDTNYSSVLEVVMRDNKAFVGYFYNHHNNNNRHPQWQGYSAMISTKVKDDNSSLNPRLTTPMSYLSAINDMYQNQESKTDITKHRIMLRDKNADYKSKAGWNKSRASDTYKINCQVSKCTGDVYIKLDDKDFYYFQKKDIVKKSMSDNKKIVYYDIVDSAKAFLLEKDDFIMYSNYHPWDKDIYTDGVRNIIMQNVKSFSFKKLANKDLLLELCTKEGICKNIQIK